MKEKKVHDLHLPKGDSPEPVDFIADMAIEFWRLEKRVGTAGVSLKNGEADAFAAQMQRLRDVFTKYQIEIHDPKGEIYIDGRSLKAIYIEDVADLPAGECRVIETVKPSLSCKGVQIFQGEVIVGQGKSAKGAQVQKAQGRP